MKVRSRTFTGSDDVDIIYAAERAEKGFNAWLRKFDSVIDLWHFDTSSTHVEREGFEQYTHTITIVYAFNENQDPFSENPVSDEALEILDDA